MRTQRFVTTGLVVVVLLVIGIASAQSKSQLLKVGHDLQKQYASSLKGLDSKGPLLQPELGNCEVTDFDLHEQGFRLAGGIGGLDFTDNPAVRPTADALRQAAAYLPLANEIGRVRKHDVAVMVVDAFGTRPTTKLGEKLFKVSSTSGSGSSVLSALEANGQVSHGALVYAYVLALVDHLPRTHFIRLVTPRTDGSEVLRQAEYAHVDDNGNKQRILVQAVDTHDYNTSQIVTAIEAGLRDASALNFDRVAINMSFGIVPCSVKKDFKASPYDSIDAYLQAVQVKYGLTREKLLKLLFTPFQPDLLESRLSQGKWLLPHVVALASSGNDHLTFPYAPAAWRHVVAVGADAALTDVREAFSNKAGIRTGGAWYYVEDPLSGRSTHALAVAGTSFASPGAAVFTALDLMLADPRCDLPNTMYALSRELEDRPLDSVVKKCLGM